MSDQELVTEENSSDATAELDAESVAAEGEATGAESASTEATVSPETDAPAKTDSQERSEVDEADEEEREEEKDAGEISEPAQADAEKTSGASGATAPETDSGVNTIFNLESRQHIKGTVKNITKFGAFVDLGLPQDGLVHISELSRRKVDRVEDVVSVGEEVDVWVKKVDRKRGRISLTMIKPVLHRIRDISDGDEVEGVVTRLEAYGAFVDIDSERDGLVHISQITHDYIKHPGEALEIGQRVNVKVLKVNRKKRQVDLSIKALLPPPVVEEAPVQEVAKEATSQGKKAAEEKVDAEEQESVPTAMAVAFASLQEKDDEEEAAEQQVDKRERDKHRQEQDDIIARTLATKQ
jgi:transcriptional accessory protein Tex/SPT6